MNFQFLINSMDSFKQQLPSLVAGISDADAKWKPPTQNWSILEIVCHLVDEEKNDFRKRIHCTLAKTGAAWSSINPELTAVNEEFNRQNLNEKLDEFASERTESIRWLLSLESPDWDAAYVHPHLGVLRAGDLLASWATHDQLHIRQIAKRKYELIGRRSGDFGAEYAGPWIEQ